MQSKLVNYSSITNKYNSRGGRKVTKIVIHHMAGVMSGKQCADYFKRTDREVSANYCIGNGGDIALSVPEEYRRWTTASYEIDSKAITIEVSNSEVGEPWLVSKNAMDSLIRLVADIGYRYNLYPITYTGDKKGTLHKHKWYSDTTCPGTYLSGKFRYIAKEANKIIEEKKGITNKSGWIKDGSNWYYYEKGKKIKDEWKFLTVTENGKKEKRWKYFDKTGKNIDQFYKENDKVWLSLAGKNKGYHRGWWTNEGMRYYFRKSSGTRVTGWQYIDNLWFYFRDSGTMATGWQWINGSIYYFRENAKQGTVGSNVRLRTNYPKEFIKGRWYLFDKEGRLQGEVLKREFEELKGEK